MRIVRALVALVAVLATSAVAVVFACAAVVVLVFAVDDASPPVPARCADFGCGLGSPHPEHVPFELAIAVGALAVVVAAVLGVRAAVGFGDAEPSCSDPASPSR